MKLSSYKYTFTHTHTIFTHTILITLIVLILLGIWLIYKYSMQQKQPHGFIELFTQSTSTTTANNNNIARLTKYSVVRTPEDTARGYMYRKTPLAFGEGLVFDYGNPVSKSFWMKNTYIPLSILYLDSSHQVIDISHNLKPLDETAITATVPEWRYAVEVSPEFADTINIGTLLLLN
jgi:uncharacterized membrane protein (UPF0127 family)